MTRDVSAERAYGTEAGYAALVASHGAQHYWKMDEASGNFMPTIGAVNLNAANIAYRQPGKFGPEANGAPLFNGTSSYAKTASAIVYGGAQRCVVETIVFVPSSGYKNASAFLWETGATAGAGGSYLLALDGGNSGTLPLMYALIWGNAAVNHANAPRLSPGVFYHVAHVIDFSQAAANENKVYVNGAQYALSALGVSDATAGLSDQVLNIGSRNGASLFGRAKIQHLAVYVGANSTLAQIQERAAYVARFKAPSSGRNTSAARTTSTARVAS